VTPHQTTIQRLFRRVSAEELETAFRGMFLHSVNTDQEQRGGCAVAIDGKAHRGRLKFEEQQASIKLTGKVLEFIRRNNPQLASSSGKKKELAERFIWHDGDIEFDDEKSK
jgi:hypothetical protein